MKLLENPFVKKYIAVIKDAISNFGDDKGSKMSAALAYRTIFAMPPMLLLIIVIGGSFLGQKAVEGQLFGFIEQFIGVELALQVQEILQKVDFKSNSGIATIISAVALIMSATGVFNEIQDSLNFIWGVRPKPKKGIMKLVLNRLICFLLIIGLGLLVFATLILNTILASFNNVILEYFPFVPVQTIDVVNNIVSFLIILLLFMSVFKFLPDVKLKFKQVFPGALVTSILFTLGKYLIGLYLSSNSTATLYGAAGSLILLLLWINFSSMIMFFGAEFTRSAIEISGADIRPTSLAEFSEMGYRRAVKFDKKEPE